MTKEAKKKARFVINIMTGAHGPRTAETDKLPLTFRLIDDATCKALATEEIKPSQVVEAIKKAMMSKHDFSWEEYDRRRQEEKMRMNVSQHEMVPVGTDSKDGAEGDAPDAPEDVVSLSSLGIGKNASAPAKKPSKIDDALGI